MNKTPLDRAYDEAAHLTTEQMHDDIMRAGSRWIDLLRQASNWDEYVFADAVEYTWVQLRAEQIESEDT